MQGGISKMKVMTDTETQDDRVERENGGKGGERVEREVEESGERVEERWKRVVERGQNDNDDDRYQARMIRDRRASMLWGVPIRSSSRSINLSVGRSIIQSTHQSISQCKCKG